MKSVLTVVLLGLYWRSSCVGAQDLDSPTGVMAEIVQRPPMVTVSWQAVEDAEQYTVTFIKTKGNSQGGLCLRASHNANVSVDTLHASIAVGKDVARNDTTMLRAYTTYSTTVVAANDVLGTSNGSTSIYFTTPEMGAARAPNDFRATANSSTIIFVQWDGFTDYCRIINGRIAKYRVHYSAQPNGTGQTKEQAIHFFSQRWAWDLGASTSLTGLTPYTNYSIQVAAENRVGDIGLYSDPILVQTAEDTPGPVVIVRFPSFFKITITWNKPSMPNGNITHYEVNFLEPSQSVINTTTGLNTSFTTPGHLEPGTEYIFIVSAYTRVGRGEPATAVVSTLNRPSAVEGVRVVALTDTSVNVSWNALIIPDFPIDNYTVVYSPVSQSHRRQDGEMTAVFPDSVTSGVITGLEPAVIYQFQVFATVTVDGVSVEGEWSDPIIALGGNWTDLNNSKCCSTTTIIFGVIIGIVVLVICTLGLFIGCILKKVVCKEQFGTEDNPAYAVSVGSKRFTKKAPQEAIYDVAF